LTRNIGVYNITWLIEFLSEASPLFLYDQYMWCKIIELYSDASANEDNSFRNHIR